MTGPTSWSGVVLRSVERARARGVRTPGGFRSESVWNGHGFGPTFRAVSLRWRAWISSAERFHLSHRTSR